MKGALVTTSWRAVAQPPLVVTTLVALLLAVATAPYLHSGNAHQVRVGVAILLACALAAIAEEPASEIAAATPNPRWVRCGTRLMFGLALTLPVAMLSLALIGRRVGETPTRVAVAQMLALLATGPAVGFGTWAWGRASQPAYAAMVGVICFSFALWLLPLDWSVTKFRPGAPPALDAFLIRCSALAGLGCAVVVAAWREPAGASIAPGWRWPWSPR